MISIDAAKIACAALRTLKFYPADENARAAIADIVARYSKTEIDALKLVDTVIETFDEWPGPASFLRHIKQEQARANEPRVAAITAQEIAELNCESCLGEGYFRNEEGIFVLCACPRSKVVNQNDLARWNAAAQRKSQEETTPERTPEDAVSLDALRRKTLAQNGLREGKFLPAAQTLQEKAGEP